jgi:MoxR-like ATPase
VNIALILGQPLLLTGEPGCGKTSLAWWLAYELGLGRPLVQVVKSTTTGRDLLYGFDELARFRDAQGGPAAARPGQEYLEFNPLGRAILFSAGPEGPLTPDIAMPDVAANAPAGSRPTVNRDLYRGDFPAERRQVVLIDELDKAPRDTPNDLLSEIERMAFHIPELRLTVQGDESRRPIVVITSNADKSLPEPFLRRCVYHHIAAPDAARRAEIIRRRRHPLAENRPGLFADALRLFEALRTGIGARGRQPGTAELLAWLDIIDRIYPPDVEKIADSPESLDASLAVLAKTQDDMALIRRILAEDR